MPDEPLSDQTFSGGALDRAAHRRTDAQAEFASRERDARLIVVGDGPAVALAGDGTLARGPLTGQSANDRIFLGQDRVGPLFVATAPDGEDDLTPLRQAVPELRPAEAALAAYAAGLIAWQGTHRHCGRCGTPTEAQQAGHSRKCPKCGLTSYPRTDPVVTMLLEDGDRCLLGRRNGAPDGMWSALAGFVEPGETPEEAVVREAYEEVGVRVIDTVYVGAQPWPFPSALMLGFRAIADPEGADALVHQPDELTAARWFTRDELRTELHARTMTIPPPLAIGHHLIAAFLARNDDAERLA